MPRPGPHRQRRYVRFSVAALLVSVAFVALVWSSLPLSLSLGLMSGATYGGAINVDDEVVFWVDGTDAMRRAEAIGLGTFGDGDQPIASKVWSNIAGLYAVDATPAILSGPLPPDDPVFEPVLEWERRHGGEVWAWTVLPPEIPPVVAVGVGTVVTSARLETALAEGVITDRLEFEPLNGIEDLWRRCFADPYGEGAPPLDAQWFIDGWGISALGADWQASTFIVGNEAWVALWHGAVPGTYGSLPTIPDLHDTDPHAADFAARVQEIAEAHELDIWVLGPVRSEAIALRVPGSASEQEAASLARLVWSGLYIRSNAAFLSSPVPLTAGEAAITGRGAGMIEVASITGSPEYSALGWTLTQPQTIALLYTVDDMPGGAPNALDRAWRAWRITLGNGFRLFVAVSATLLAVSLTATVAALIADRRAALRAITAQERERLRRDAHDKVYNRLSALSKRVARAGDADDGAAAPLGEVAEDIRRTVGELQQILGSDVEHTSSALADVSLAEQLGAVCAAQGARLGVTVSCEVGPGVPPVAPDLGWDLQCIVEEAITNAVRHGGASEVRVGVVPLASGGLRLTVADDGSGCIVTDAASAPDGSTGLKGIKERVEEHGGAVSLTSSGSGAILTVTIPRV